MCDQPKKRGLVFPKRVDSKQSKKDPVPIQTIDHSSLILPSDYLSTLIRNFQITAKDLELSEEEFQAFLKG